MEKRSSVTSEILSLPEPPEGWSWSVEEYLGDYQFGRVYAQGEALTIALRREAKILSITFHPIFRGLSPYVVLTSEGQEGLHRRAEEYLTDFYKRLEEMQFSKDVISKYR